VGIGGGLDPLALYARQAVLQRNRDGGAQSFSVLGIGGLGGSAVVLDAGEDRRFELSPTLAQAPQQPHAVLSGAPWHRPLSGPWPLGWR
jgi:hypothetical protein